MPGKKPVVFVPGFPGSHLFDRDADRRIFFRFWLLSSPTAKALILPRLRGPIHPNHGDGVVPDRPIARAATLGFFDVAKQADTLYDILRNLGYSGVGDPRFEPVGWDWRRSVDSGVNHAAVAGAIETLHGDSGAKVTIIAHSTGGLVVRSLLEERPDLVDKIERLIAFGVPWAGALKHLAQLTGKGKFAQLDRSEAHDVVSHSWAAFDLLPPDPRTAPAVAGLQLVTDAQDGDREVGLLSERRWIPQAHRAVAETRAIRAHERFGRRNQGFDLGGRSLEIVNIVGFGLDTAYRARIGSGSKLDLIEGVDDRQLDDGDGTIPRRSAGWLNGETVRTFHVPIGVQPYPYTRTARHSRLWSNQGGSELLGHFLGNPQQDEEFPVFAYAAIDHDDAVGPITKHPTTGLAIPRSVRIRIVAYDRFGAPLTDVRFSIAGRWDPAWSVTNSGGVDGRHLVVVPISAGTSASGERRRFALTIHWQETGQQRSIERVLVV